MARMIVIGVLAVILLVLAYPWEVRRYAKRQGTWKSRG